MKGFEGMPSWHEMSEEDRQNLVEQTAKKIAADTGYKSKEEKKARKRANGTLNGSDSRDPKKSDGNRPGATRVKIKRGGVASVPKYMKQ